MNDRRHVHVFSACSFMPDGSVAALVCGCAIVINLKVAVKEEEVGEIKGRLEGGGGTCLVFNNAIDKAENSETTG